MPTAGSCRHGMIGPRIPVFLQENRHQSAFGFLGKGEQVVLAVNPDEVAQLDLASRYQVRQRKNDVFFDGTLQVTRTVLGIRPFDEQKTLYRRSATEDELMIARMN